MNDQPLTLRPGAVQEITSAEIDGQLMHALRNPRDIKVCAKDAVDLATLTDATAESCLYTLKRKDKDGTQVLIEGPSVRLAEILIYAWSNVRAGARVIDEDAKFVTAQGVYADLQKNNRIAFEVKRRITTRSGQRFGDDMVAVTANAACSIALRNAVFKGIPKAIWEPVYLAARAHAVGTKDQLPARVQRAIEYFAKAGASEEQLLKALRIEKRDQITQDHLGILIGLTNALKSDEVSIDEALGEGGFVETEIVRLSGDAPEGEECTDVGKKLEADSQKRAPKGKGAGAKNKSAATPKDDGGPPDQRKVAAKDGEAADQGKDAPEGGDADSAQDDDEPDDKFIARIRAAKPIGEKRKLVDEHRGAISRIAETAEDSDLRKQAAALLRSFEERKDK